MGRKDNIAGDGRRELQNGITTLFLIYMGAAYPLIMHDKYFDITVTKYRAFYIALCIYAVLMVLAVLVDVLGRNVSTGGAPVATWMSLKGRHTVTDLSDA